MIYGTPLGAVKPFALFQEAAELALRGEDNHAAYTRSWNAYDPLRREVARLEIEYKRLKARSDETQKPTLQKLEAQRKLSPVKHLYEQRRRELKNAANFKRVADDLAWARSAKRPRDNFLVLAAAFKNAKDLWELDAEEFWGASRNLLTRIENAFQRLIGRRFKPNAVASGRKISYFYPHPGYRKELIPIKDDQTAVQHFSSEAVILKDPRMVEKLRAHEIQHVRQFAEGRIKYFSTVWEGIVHEHADRPLEKEALAVEEKTQRFLFPDVRMA